MESETVRGAVGAIFKPAGAFFFADGGFDAISPGDGEDAIFVEKGPRNRRPVAGVVGRNRRRKLTTTPRHAIKAHPRWAKAMVDPATTSHSTL